MSSAKKSMDIRFTVDPTNIQLSESQVDSIQNQITSKILQIAVDSGLGQVAWLEAGGYVKYSKGDI